MMRHLVLSLSLIPLLCHGHGGYISTYPKARFFVCYDNRVEKIEPFWPDKTIYQGCFLSDTPCPKTGKNSLHYGQYATKAHAKHGLIRCKRANPIFRHPQRMA
jgi:hypothetical protein